MSYFYSVITLRAFFFKFFLSWLNVVFALSMTPKTYCCQKKKIILGIFVVFCKNTLKIVLCVEKVTLPLTGNYLTCFFFSISGGVGTWIELCLNNYLFPLRIVFLCHYQNKSSTNKNVQLSEHYCIYEITGIFSHFHFTARKNTGCLCQTHMSVILLPGFRS